jgi:MOSC domain-containing protein YiiM
MRVARLFLSPEHVYVGHYGGPSGRTPMTEVDRVQAVAGRGLVGDRYFAREQGHKGQVTLFAEETWLRLCREFARSDRGPEVFRRNILVGGADLNALVGVRFEIQGVALEGSEYCKPCFWMDEAFAPGAFDALVDWKAGGLRARILSDGWIAAEVPAKA